jgi:hypothetical protein
MEILRINDMTGGWFVGNFTPSAYKTENFEVSYKKHHKGEFWDVHYHHTVTEINLLMKGKILMQGKELNSGDIFVLYPYEIADPIFLEDCEIICVKTLSINDKIKIKKI